MPAEALILLIKLYRNLISPLFPPSCRFYPSCSAYSIEALHIHGLVKGFGLSVWRVLRCNPFSRGGYDPVPRRCESHNIEGM
ncbi:MAG: membrane protein insertion efficiency factor YidD [Bacteroidetes bacterium]|nr:membrane protein insertion efficiency factor YidD [Bacteroidota bacterium]